MRKKRQRARPATWCRVGWTGGASVRTDERSNNNDSDISSKGSHALEALTSWRDCPKGFKGADLFNPHNNPGRQVS